MKFEYKIIKIPGNLEDWLNEYGALGWRVVQVMPNDGLVLLERFEIPDSDIEFPDA